MLLSSTRQSPHRVAGRSAATASLRADLCESLWRAVLLSWCPAVPLFSCPVSGEAESCCHCIRSVGSSHQRPALHTADLSCPCPRPRPMRWHTTHQGSRSPGAGQARCSRVSALCPCHDRWEPITQPRQLVPHARCCRAPGHPVPPTPSSVQGPCGSGARASVSWALLGAAEALWWDTGGSSNPSLPRSPSLARWYLGAALFSPG